VHQGRPLSPVLFNIFIADPSAILHETPANRCIPTGKGIGHPDKLPKDSTKLRDYVQDLTIHRRTQHLTGQIYIQSKVLSFSNLKFHPILFDWLRRSGFHLQLNCLTSSRIQAVGQLLHRIPTESRASQIEEAITTVFKSTSNSIPEFQLRSETIFHNDERRKVLRVYSAPGNVAKLDKLFSDRYGQTIQDKAMFISMSTWTRLPGPTKSELIRSQAEYIDNFRAVTIPGVKSLEAVPPNLRETFNLGQ